MYCHNLHQENSAWFFFPSLDDINQAVNSCVKESQNNFLFTIDLFFFNALNEITINVVIADVVVQIHYPHYLDTGITLVSMRIYALPTRSIS